MRILFLSAWCPVPADNGIRLRTSNLLRGLQRQHAVDLLCFAPQPLSAGQQQQLARLCQHAELIPDDPFPYRPVSRLRSALSSTPHSVLANYSQLMAAAVRRRDPQAYDLVVAEDLHTAPYALLLERPRLLEGLEIANLHNAAAQASSLPGRLRAQLMWQKSQLYLRKLLRHFQAVTTVSPAESALVAPLLAADTPLHCVPNGVDLAANRGDFGPPEPNTLVYPGALSYDANYDAVSFFVRMIWPLVRAEIPTARLIVTGRVTAEQIAALDADGLVFTGFLEDVRPTIARAWAEVVPLRIGSGTRLKVLEALALGTPVISTTKGYEGLDLVPGRDLIAADEPTAFAAQVVRLLRSAELRTQLAAAGQRAVPPYDWAAASTMLEAAIACCAPNHQNVVRTTQPSSLGPRGS